MTASSSSDVVRCKPVVLIIRDGWGASPSPREMAEREGNATLLARTPVNDRLLAERPWSFLTTCGEAVGLPAGQMGNSEVGHLNLGAGRIVYQDLTRIDRAIRDESFFECPALVGAMTWVREKSSRLHLMGLCSDGGVHSQLTHLFALLEMCRRHGVRDVDIHCFMDGRDTAPDSGAGYLSRLQEQIAATGVGRIATVVGRYFAMDRDRRWDRVEKAYRLVVCGQGEVTCPDPVDAIRRWYAEGKTDEFIPPTVISSGPEAPPHGVRDGDAVLFYNFRSDRARQLTRALMEEGFSVFRRDPWPRVHFVGMTQYDDTFGLPIAFPPVALTNKLGDVLALNWRTQLRMAETEKYAHVTFFFNGGEEDPLPGEDRCLVPSPKVATYDLQPEMSAVELTQKAVERIRARQHDFVCINYANADMVGHTGSLPAAIRAVETVDECVGQLLECLLEVGGAALVTADHGNAERMLDEHGKPFTAHTTNPVHIVYVAADSSRWRLQDGILADVAPTVLALLGLPAPAEMTGKSLLVPVHNAP